MSRASSSLPVPLSPRISTVAESLAILWTRSMISRVARLGPTMNSRSFCSATSALRRMTCRLKSCRSLALRDERPHAFGVEVLGDVVIGPVPHRLDGGVELLERRDDDDFDVAGSSP